MLSIDMTGGGARQLRTDWIVRTYGEKIETTSAFFFWINPDTEEGFTSHYFNVTQAKATDDLSASNAGNTASSTTDAKSQNSHHAARKISLGVCLGLGLPVVLVAAVWMAIVLRNRRAVRRRERNLHLGRNSRIICRRCHQRSLRTDQLGAIKSTRRMLCLQYRKLMAICHQSSWDE